jgi:uncharacterized protein YjbI with pentapeptide repeats
MDKIFIEDKKYEKYNFTQKSLSKGEYDNCTFISCDFSNSDLTEIKFSECEFISCNLSLAKLVKTAFQNVKFKECKMLGLYFQNCNPFGLSVSFDSCNLSHSIFNKTKLKKTIFKNTQLHEVDYSECDLSGAIFENCDLMRATFINTMLEKADFRTSFHYSIDPEMNRIKKAKFSLISLPGLLNKYDIEIDKT